MPDRTGSSLRRRFRPFGGLESSTSDAPCRYPARPERVQIKSDSQDRFHRALVKEHSFHDPERLPSTGAPLPPACAECGRARHRAPGLAACGAGFQRFPSLSPERPSGPRLRGSPSFVPGRAALPEIQGSSPRTVGQIGFASCQLLQSSRFLSTTVE